MKHRGWNMNGLRREDEDERRRALLECYSQDLYLHCESLHCKIPCTYKEIVDGFINHTTELCIID
jgi:hypothetical protein